MEKILPERKSILLYSAILALAGGILLFLYSQETQAEVRQVRVIGNTLLSAEEIGKRSGIRPGLVSNSSLSQAGKAIEEIPAIREADLNVIGNEVVIEVVERKCSAIINTNGRLFDLDENLVILFRDRVRCANVPVITGTFKREANRFEEPSLKRIIKGLAMMEADQPGMYTRISEVSVMSDGAIKIFFVQPQVQMILPAQIDSSALHRRMHATLAYLRKQDGIVDMRSAEAIFTPRR